MTAHEQVLMGLPTLAEIEQRLGEWVVTVSGNRKALLDIPLQYTDKTTISRSFVSEVTGLPEEPLRIALRDHRHLLADLEQEMHRDRIQASEWLTRVIQGMQRENIMPDVLQAMIAEGIIVEGYNVGDCDKRRRLLRWYESLDDQEKLAVETYGDQLKPAYLETIQELAGISPAPLYNLTRTEIGKDVLRRRAEVAAPPGRTGTHEVKRRVDEWLKDVLSSREKLLTVQLNASGPLAVSVPYSPLQQCRVIVSPASPIITMPVSVLSSALLMVGTTKVIQC